MIRSVLPPLPMTSLAAELLGWFVFKERGITNRVIASCVMLSGVLIFFLTKPDAQGKTMVGLIGAMMVAGAAIIGMAIALYLTRPLPVNQPVESKS